MADFIPQQVVKLTHDFKSYHAYQGDSNDCGPYCVSMVANGLYRAKLVHAKALAEELSSRGLPDRIPNWATLPWGMARLLRNLSLDSRWRYGVSFKRLFDNLRRDITTIVIIGEPLRFTKGKYSKTSRAYTSIRDQKPLLAELLRVFPWDGWSHYKILVAWEPDRGLGFVDPGMRYPSGMSWQKFDEFRRQWNWMGREIVEVRRP